jgi:hypothetical protein
MDKRTRLCTNLITIVLLLFVYQSTQAQIQRWCLNPGVKLGYTLGSNSGFVWGVEISVTTYKETESGGLPVVFGALISLESYPTFRLTHLALEFLPIPFVGISAGPSFIRSDTDVQVGVSTTIFGGAVILPYCRLTYIPNSSNINEIGTFVKLPIPLNAKAISY